MKSVHCAAALVLPLLTSANHAYGEEAYRWYRCNTHTHTSAPPGSDANESPAFVAQWYKSHGYQCVVITDHEFHTDVAPLNQQYGSDGEFLVLRGQEITQIIADAGHPGGVRHAHVNGIGTDRLIMPIRPKDAADKTGLLKLAADGVSVTHTLARNLAQITQAGGLAQINHPNLVWSIGIEDLLPIDAPYLMEIWNAFPTSNNLGSDDANSTEALWDALLTRGKTVWGVASDDSHEYHAFDNREAPTPGKGWIVLQASALTVPAVVEAMRKGRFYASTGIALAHYQLDRTGISIQVAQSTEWSPSLPPSARYTTRFIGANGAVLAQMSGLTPHYRFKGTEQYVRATISDSDGRKAWTQPVFLDPRR